MAERVPASAADATDEGDAANTAQLLAYLRRIASGHDSWREQLNGRWVVFLRYRARTYCLLPLEYAPLPERAAPVAPGQETERSGL